MMLKMSKIFGKVSSTTLKCNLGGPAGGSASLCLLVREKQLPNRHDEHEMVKAGENYRNKKYVLFNEKDGNFAAAGA